MNDKEILDFIKLQKKTGSSDEKIKEFLKGEGLSDEDIERSLSLVESMNDEKLVKEVKKIHGEDKNALPKIKTGQYWIVFLAMIILLAIIGLIYLFLGPK